MLIIDLESVRHGVGPKGLNGGENSRDFWPHGIYSLYRLLYTHKETEVQRGNCQRLLSQ